MSGGMASMATRSGGSAGGTGAGSAGGTGAGPAGGTGAGPSGGAGARGALSRRVRALAFGRGSPWSPTQLALTAAAGLGVAVVLGSLSLTAVVASPWWLLVLVPAVGMRFTGTALPLLLGLTLLCTWTVHVPVGSFSWWSVPAGVGVVLWHAATSLSAALPPGATADRGLLGRWVWRALAVAVAAPVAAALVAIVPVVPPGTAALASGSALLGLAVLVWLARSESVADHE